LARRRQHPSRCSEFEAIRVGYNSSPENRNRGAVYVASIFFVVTAILGPLPYFLGYFGRYYVFLILSWGIILIYASIRLVASSATVENVKRYERLITMSMLLLIFSLIAEAFVP
jgi:4-hydroxybenzoate polyprenyltransferase